MPAGLSPKEAVEQSFPHCLSLVYPHRETNAAGKELTRTLADSVMSEYLSVEERNALLSATVVQVIGLMLQLAANGDAPTPPFFPVPTVLRAIYMLPGQPNDLLNQESLQNQVCFSSQFWLIAQAGCVNAEEVRPACADSERRQVPAAAQQCA